MRLIRKIKAIIRAWFLTLTFCRCLLLLFFLFYLDTKIGQTSSKTFDIKVLPSLLGHTAGEITVEFLFLEFRPIR